MKFNLRKILSVAGIFLLGAVVGGAITGYGTAYYFGQFVRYGTSLSQMVEIKSKVSTLDKLRQGNTTEAINHLEMMLDGNLVYFLGGIDGSANEQKEIRKVLKTVKEYRKQFPRSTKYPEADKDIANILSEADK